MSQDFTSTIHEVEQTFAKMVSLPCFVLEQMSLLECYKITTNSGRKISKGYVYYLSSSVTFGRDKLSEKSLIKPKNRC